MTSYPHQWKENRPRPPMRRHHKESWFECLRRHCDDYGVDHFKVMELYQDLRQHHQNDERAARDAAWLWGITDDE